VNQKASCCLTSTSTPRARSQQVLHLYRDERVLGILPFFHSFGYLVSGSSCSTTRAWSFILPARVVAIGKLVRRLPRHVLVTTPTFLQLYQRRCTRAIHSLRVVLTGAEKLPSRLAQAFEDRFASDRSRATASPNALLRPVIVRTSEPPDTTNRPHGGELSANRCPGVSHRRRRSSCTPRCVSPLHEVGDQASASRCCRR